MITATICTIGDEILIGQIVDTNSSMIAKELNSIGIKVVSMISCSDGKRDIISTLKRGLKRSEIVIVTGGLGPTKDDITKSALVQLSGSERFIENKAQMAIIKRILKSRDIPMSDINRAQALVPEGCRVITNQVGTAPIMQFNFPKEKFGKDNILFTLPGVPFEAECALPKVIETIKRHYSLNNIIHRTISTFGIPESILAKRIEKWENELEKSIHLAYLPNPILGVRLRLSIYNADRKKGEELIEKEVSKLKKILGDAIYSQEQLSPVEVVGKMLLNEGATISTAESCTGGMIAHLFTLIPGASNYFWGSVVSYDNSVKQNTLGVNPLTLKKFGAVSKECVVEMAEGVRKKLKTTYSIATSGIAGPTGGTKSKPVGTVWIAVSGPKGTKSLKLQTMSNRETNIKRFASNAIDIFRKALLSKEI